MALSKHCCWWTAYALGVINVVLFFSLFGASSAIVLPFGDLCSGMPRTGKIQLYIVADLFLQTTKAWDFRYVFPDKYHSTMMCSMQGSRTRTSTNTSGFAQL